MTTGLYHLTLGGETFNLDVYRQKVCDTCIKIRSSVICELVYMRVEGIIKYMAAHTGADYFCCGGMLADATVRRLKWLSHHLFRLLSCFCVLR
jgi:hypothetical protein